MSALDIARRFLELGWQPVPVPHRSKNPGFDGWQNLRITQEDAQKYFNGAPQNIGVLLGAPSKGLVDIDLDCPEAVTLAPYFLPATPGRFGRASKRASHWLYFSPFERLLQFKDPDAPNDKAMLCEIRSTGEHTVFPGSVHVEGEPIEFEDGSDPTKVPAVEKKVLLESVGKLASASLLARYFPAKGARHNLCWALGGALLRMGWSVEETTDFVGLVAWVGGSEDPAARAARVAGTAERVAANEEVTGWPTVAENLRGDGAKIIKKIRKWLPVRARVPDAAGASSVPGADNEDRVSIIAGFDELEVADAMIPALATLPNVYYRGWKLAEIVRDPNETIEDGITRKPDAPRIVAMPRARLRGLVSHVCAFQRWKLVKEVWTLVSCPVPDDPISELHVRGAWPGIRRLEGIAECPVLRPDGTVLDVPGYDQATGLFYAPNADYPTIPPEPTLDDATTAIAALYDIVQDFPFQNEEHCSAWMALLLTPFADTAINDCVPLGLFDKNVNRAGGTKLADIIGQIYSGRSLARMVHTNEDEMRKRLLSLAMAADPIVLLDNVKGTLDSQVLAATLTSRIYQDRKLGVTEMVSMPMRALWLVTAKNLTLSTELIGRTLHVRLESPLEHPETRTGFKYPDLEAHVREQRPALASAALTVLRGYFAAGCPDQKLTPWGSFEGWSRVVRGALVWAGMPDPIGGRTELVESGDTEGNALESALTAWQLAFGAKVMLASEVIDTMSRHPDLIKGLSELCGCDPQKLDTRTLGLALRTNKRRTAGKLRFNHQKKGPKGVPWYVEGVGG